MLTGTIDLAFNVGHALHISPPDYVRAILGTQDSWCARTCPPTELELAAVREWKKGLPALAHILIPAVPWTPAGVSFPLSDLLFRPSVVFRYPDGTDVADPTPEQRWFFINGICTDHNVVVINARYLHKLFGRPLTVLHNFTRGVVPDLAACALGKEWDRVTESAAVAFPHVYAAMKTETAERVILLAHSQGTILSAVILALLEELHPPTHARLAAHAVVAPERAVARRLAKRWNFARTVGAKGLGRAADLAGPASFEWPGHGRRQPEAVTPEELRKLEIYCFANCASEMVHVPVRNGTAVPWIESYGNDKDFVARLGVLANASGPGSVCIEGDRYSRDGAWGHLLNAHYLYPMMKARASGDPAGGLTPFKDNQLPIPRLFGYLDEKSAPSLPRPPRTRRRATDAPPRSLGRSHRRPASPEPVAAL